MRHEIFRTLVHGGSGGSWRFSAGGGVGDAGKDAWNLPQMAVYLKARILYSNETLPEALKEIGSRFSDGNSGMAAEAGLFFLRVEKRMEEEAGKAFAEIWKEEMEKFPDDFPLRKQDLEALQALGENLGYADKKTQERTILFYLEQADDSLAFLKKEMESRTKLYRSLGMAAGLFILVLFA